MRYQSERTFFPPAWLSSLASSLAICFILIFLTGRKNATQLIFQFQRCVTLSLPPVPVLACVCLSMCVCVRVWRSLGKGNLCAYRYLYCLVERFFFPFPPSLFFFLLFAEGWGKMPRWPILWTFGVSAPFRTRRASPRSMTLDNHNSCSAFDSVRFFYTHWSVFWQCVLLFPISSFGSIQRSRCLVTGVFAWIFSELRKTPSQNGRARKRRERWWTYTHTHTQHAWLRVWGEQFYRARRPVQPRVSFAQISSFFARGKLTYLQTISTSPTPLRPSFLRDKRCTGGKIIDPHLFFLSPFIPRILGNAFFFMLCTADRVWFALSGFITSIACGFWIDFDLGWRNINGDFGHRVLE